jgi:hypothetical protein
MAAIKEYIASILSDAAYTDVRTVATDVHGVNLRILCTSHLIRVVAH